MLANVNRLIVVAVLIGLLEVQARTQDVQPSAYGLSYFSNLFENVRNGNIDAFAGIRGVIEMRDSAVAGLAEYALSPAGIDVGDIPSNRLYAITALDGIGTSRAYAAICNVVSIQSNPEVRGAALHALAHHYYERAVGDTMLVSPEVVHLFLQNADDTVLVDGLAKRIGEIAREGLNSWADLKYGDLALNQTQVRTGGVTIPIREFRELWWNKVKDKMRWNPGTSKYIITP